MICSHTTSLVPLGLSVVASVAVVAVAQTDLPPTETVLTTLVDAAVNRHWSVLLSAVVVLAVWILRSVVNESRAPLFHTKLAGWLTNVAVSTASVLAGTTMLGQPFTTSLITRVVAVAGGVTIFVEGWQDFREWWAGRKASAPPTGRP